MLQEFLRKTFQGKGKKRPRHLVLVVWVDIIPPWPSTFLAALVNYVKIQSKSLAFWALSKQTGGNKNSLIAFRESKIGLKNKSARLPKEGIYELFVYEGIIRHTVKNGGDNKTMDVIQKFQELLKKLFQFEVSDLDFGIYRVLNYKRDQIEKFIQEDLKNKVEDAFAKHKDERLTDINQRFESAKEKVNQNLGPTAFTPTGDLKEEFKDTPVGKDFLLVKAQKEEAEAIDEIKLQVFNDLYNFFSRYYEEGDFVPHYRYSIKGHKYAIPYNGEEVKLYWVNSEQYYTKTGVLFRDYTFRANDYKVIFRIVSAKEELASNKATRERFFVLDDEQPLTIENKALIIRFQYRELTEDEVKDYEVVGGSNAAKQEKINQRSYDEVLKRAKDPTLGGFLGKEYKNGNPLLLYHISRFSAKTQKTTLFTKP